VSSGEESNRERVGRGGQGTRCGGTKPDEKDNLPEKGGGGGRHPRGESASIFVREAWKAREGFTKEGVLNKQRAKGGEGVGKANQTLVGKSATSGKTRRED